jgi:ribosomal protein S12 methylthiotransferase accessory factor
VLADPRVLQFASALLLPVGDVAAASRKYGNRATVFAHLEAGQSLQNAQLMAAASGAAGSLRGDAAAARVLERLAPHLPQGGCWLPMPALALGLPPTPQQVRQQATEGWLRLSPSPQAAGGFAWTAAGAAPDGTRVVGSGRSHTARLALVKAEAEAWERRAWATLGPVVDGTAADVAPVVDPATLVRYSAAQHRRAGFPFAPHAPRRRALWVDAVDMGSGRAVRVAADCVHALAALPARERRSAHTSTSTSGVAAATDAETALARATLELIERDAVLRCWVPGTPPPRLAEARLPVAARRRLQALREAGHRVVVLQPPASVAVLAVFVQALQRPFTAITAAADFDPEAALHKALDEADGRAAHALACPAPPLPRAADVAGVHDVNRLYQSPRFWRQADAFAAGPVRGGLRTGACGDWPALRAALAAAGQPLVAADITPPGASIHQGRTPLRVVRALVPGLLPIWFGHGLEPAGLPAFQALRPATRRALAMHPFT